MRFISVLVLIIIAVLLTFIFTSYYYRKSQWQDKIYGISESNNPGFFGQLKSLVYKTSEKYDQDTSPYVPFVENPVSYRTTETHQDTSPKPEDVLQPYPEKDKYRKKEAKILVNETRCREILEKIFQKKFPKTKKLPWLKNHTGRNLEIDCYNEELRLGLEYHGKQHYKWPNNWMETEKDFRAQQDRDRLKIKLCRKRGVDLIIVPYTVHYDDLYSYIIEELERLGRIEIED